MENALCREHDPEIFFPQGKPGQKVKSHAVERARRICAACPIACRIECARLALDTGAEDGVWSGTDFGDTPESRLAAKNALSLLAGRGAYVSPSREIGVCEGVCGRPLRRHRDRLEDYPGTVAVAGHGRCSSCHRAWRSGAARPERVAS